MPKITVTTIYGHKANKPLVEIRLPRDKPDTPKARRNMVQLSIDEARDLAMNILQAAESAIQDAFIVEFFQSAGLEEGQIGALLTVFRTRRHDRQNDASA